MSETLPPSWALEARNSLEERWPGATQLLPHPNNAANIVFCDPAAGYAARMPRALTEERIAAIDREVYLLEVLDRAPPPPIDPPFQIPKLLDFGVEWPYIVASYIPGEVMHEPQLPSCDLQAIAETLADFIHWLSATIRVVYPDAFSLVPADFPRKRQLHNLAALGWQSLHGRAPNLEGLLHEILDNYHDFALPASDQPFFGHNDLTFSNMALRRTGEGWRLCGIFDFGLAQPSSPAQEMRHLYGVNPAAAEVCALRYEQLSGERVNRVALRLWGSADYAPRMQYILTYGSPSYLFASAKAGLERIYPDVDWSELDYAYRRLG